MTEDPAEVICDEIAQHLNEVQTQESNPFAPFTFVAKNPEDPSSELDQVADTITMFVYPNDYQEARSGRGRGAPMVAQCSIAVIVARNLTPEFTRRKLHGLCMAIVAELRGRSMGGYRWRDPQVGKADVARLKEKQFHLGMVLNYTGTC